LDLSLAGLPQDIIRLLNITEVDKTTTDETTKQWLWGIASAAFIQESTKTGFQFQNAL